ncbi:unnamed protein product [Dovyalis caffra]|uniref:Uncharacterized protein n=1 Tax=Dovyalis caffra TaxID=77055 RepID=A0AAV1S5X0_9ROSI|nr:unnamed protein product [Dovyalis caffra]
MWETSRFVWETIRRTNVVGKSDGVFEIDLRGKKTIDGQGWSVVMIEWHKYCGCLLRRVEMTSRMCELVYGLRDLFVMIFCKDGGNYGFDDYMVVRGLWLTREGAMSLTMKGYVEMVVYKGLEER